MRHLAGDHHLQRGSNRFTNADLTIANGTLTAVSSSDGGYHLDGDFTPSASTTGPRPT
ncbi:Ig-like domain-containing protein [Pseudomonas fluorescens]|uniref:Ig-like domain-containing protein n=1 Tax=Pseudomonas fluorescens TaxID=294 RepID=UPI000AF57DEB